MSEGIIDDIGIQNVVVSDHVPVSVPEHLVFEFLVQRIHTRIDDSDHSLLMGLPNVPCQVRLDNGRVELGWRAVLRCGVTGVIRRGSQMHVPVRFCIHYIGAQLQKCNRVGYTQSVLQLELVHVDFWNVHYALADVGKVAWFVGVIFTGENSHQHHSWNVLWSAWILGKQRTLRYNG